MVCRHIAKLLLYKFENYSPTKPIRVSPVGSDRLKEHLISDALFCALRSFENRISLITSLADVEPILDFVIRLSFESVSECGDSAVNGSIVHLSHCHWVVIASILSKIVFHAVSIKFKSSDDFRN